MINNDNLRFSIHNHHLAPSYSVPVVDLYQSEKNIQVVSGSIGMAGGEPDRHIDSGTFFAWRLKQALGLESASPSYFPGAVIPGPGGAACAELLRGNLLFEQFQFLLDFDGEAAERIFRLAGESHSEFSQTEQAPPRFFSSQATGHGAWLWKYVEAPELFFLHQLDLPPRPAAHAGLALSALAALARQKWREVQVGAESCALEDLLGLISRAWYSSTRGAVVWTEGALQAVRLAVLQYRSFVDDENLLPFLFELEAMASYLSLGEKKRSFARGVFAGNYIEVAMAPITSIKATEFCVRERLFDEVINLSGRGFAPIVVNEYGLVADGNHRLSAAYIWNILKYTQDLEWCLENDHFQKRVADFGRAVEKGLVGQAGTISAVSLHQALDHLAQFLCRPEWRARLNNYTKPLLKSHDFIGELPVVHLPEYLSGAVIKADYDDGIATMRACPSVYEAMADNENFVLPPRASYHFTDAALLPWFKVLREKSGRLTLKESRRI